MNPRKAILLILGFSLCAFLVAQRRRNEELAQRETLRRELLRQSVWAQEEERRRIARELHDEAGQALTALSWGLSAVETALPETSTAAHQRLQELRQLTEGVMDRLRQLTSRLRPAVLDELGLVAALVSYTDEISAHTPFTVEVKVKGERRRLPTELETTLYRIAQAAITNVAKHAQATSVVVHLEFGTQTVTLSITDNGRGMNVAAAQQATIRGQGWGLAGIGERIQLVGGTLTLDSAPGQGTTVRVSVPVH